MAFTINYGATDPNRVLNLKSEKLYDLMENIERCVTQQQVLGPEQFGFSRPAVTALGKDVFDKLGERLIAEDGQKYSSRFERTQRIVECMRFNGKTYAEFSGMKPANSDGTYSMSQIDLMKLHVQSLIALNALNDGRTIVSAVTPDSRHEPVDLSFDSFLPRQVEPPQKMHRFKRFIIKLFPSAFREEQNNYRLQLSAHENAERYHSGIAEIRRQSAEQAGSLRNEAKRADMDNVSRQRISYSTEMSIVYGQQVPEYKPRQNENSRHNDAPTLK